MNTEDFISLNFKTALQIHKQCDKLNLSSDKARLLTYIHFRLFKNETTSEKINLKHAEIAQVIDFLNDRDGERTSLRKSGCYDAFITVSDEIRTLDGRLREDHGLEVRIKSELNNRALLHCDYSFREKMIELYRNKILPCLAEEEVAG